MSGPVVPQQNEHAQRQMSHAPGRGIPGWRTFVSLSRRVRALLVGAVTFVVLFTLMLTVPVPYVILSPGPTFNTLGEGYGQQIITINGIKTKATTGNLNMTTVNVGTDSITAFDALAGWLIHDRVVVPKAAVYPPGQSEQQVNRQNTQDFVASQDSAIEASSCELGYPKQVGVQTVDGSGASAKALKPSDIIEQIDGKPAATVDELTGLLKAQTPGTTAVVIIKRQGKQQTVSIALGKPLAGRTGASLGISLGDVCQAPYAVDLGLANEIGGPSAGMMFALGIIDKVGTKDLTGGRFIAGTGTIDAAGNVGPIGGIQLKMIAARKAGATVFLAPAGNCSDVLGAIPGGLDVVKVNTLHEAVQELEALQAGKALQHC
ncbi:MAG: PDZ domain-containing protein [Jatrophihabitantaceae bacterium]